MPRDGIYWAYAEVKKHRSARGFGGSHQAYLTLKCIMDLKAWRGYLPPRHISAPPTP